MEKSGQIASYTAGAVTAGMGGVSMTFSEILSATALVVGIIGVLFRMWIDYKTYRLRKRSAED